MAIAAAAYGLLAAVRVGRAEEESGRTEVVLAAPVSRATANTAGLPRSRRPDRPARARRVRRLGRGEHPAGGAAYLALASGMTAAVFTGIGALGEPTPADPARRARHWPRRRSACCWCCGSSPTPVPGAGWLPLATPLGWAELLRPLLVRNRWSCLLPAATTALLLARGRAGLAGGTLAPGYFQRDDSADPRLWLLSSPTAQAVQLPKRRSSSLGWPATAAS